jgi:hypothetical protein
MPSQGKQGGGDLTTTHSDMHDPDQVSGQFPPLCMKCCYEEHNKNKFSTVIGCKDRWTKYGGNTTSVVFMHQVRSHTKPSASLH